jgi:hypothetical protein
MKKYILSTLSLLAFVSVSFSQYTLYPPTNLNTYAVECCVLLKWHRPATPAGTLPAGLLGYIVYRESDSIGYSALPNDTSFWDFEVIPWGTYHYTVKAWYDLTFYGLPGQFGASVPSNQSIINIVCCCSLPFFEPWNGNGFSYNGWSFSPDQGNWKYNIETGNPWPCVEFSGTPIRTDYLFILRTKFLSGDPWGPCTDIWLEFDVALDNINPTGNEHMAAVLYIDNTWSNPIWEETNTGSTGWTHVKMLINQVRGKAFRLGFRASGSNSTDIARWMVDNISIYGICRPPLNLNATAMPENHMNLTWEPPVCDTGYYPSVLLMGYNVYRSDSSGPYHKLNTAPITAVTYVDVLPAGYYPGQLCYYVTDLYKKVADGLILCESSSDTSCLLVTGNHEIGEQTVTILPNPARESCKIGFPPGTERISLVDLTGNVLADQAISSDQRFFILDLTPFPKGLYLVRVYTRSGMHVLKFVHD